MKQEIKENSRLLSSLVLFFLIPPVIILAALLFNAIKENDTSNIILSFSFLVINILLLLLLIIHKLTVVVNKHKLYIKYPPYYFKAKTILVDQVEKISIVQYDALSDFGGWGYKKSKKWGQGLTTKGNIGLHIILRDGKKYLVSIFDKEGIARVLGIDTSA